MTFRFEMHLRPGWCAVVLSAVCWAVALPALATPAADSAAVGCLAPDGTRYPPGKRYTLNQHELDQRKAAGEWVSDGDAILAQCQFLVDVTTSQHPVPEQRRYVWVSFEWGQ